MTELELRSYVNSNKIEQTEEEKQKYNNSLDYLNKENDLKIMKDAVEATITSERKHLKVFLSLVDKAKLTLEVKDYENLKKYFIRELTQEEREKAAETLKSTYALFIDQDNALMQQIDSILSEIDKTNNFDRILEVDSLSNLIIDEQNNAKYRSLYLIYKADSVKDQNAFAAYDLLNGATDCIKKVQDASVSTMLRIKQSAVRRKVAEAAKKQEENKNKPTNTSNLGKIDKINELLNKAESNLDDKALEEACELIKTLPDGEEKEKLTKRAIAINEKIKEAEEKFKKAKELISKAENMGGKYPVEQGAKKAIKEAYDEVNKLDDCQVKTSLIQRLNNLVINMTKKFMKELDILENRIANNKDVSQDDITNLRSLFAELYSDEIKEIGFSKAGATGVGVRLNILIRKYNCQAQDLYKKSIKVEKKGKKGKKVKKPFSLKDKLIEAKPGIIYSIKKALANKKQNYIFKKLEKAKKDNKTKKINKYQKKYDKILQFQAERDEINTVRLFRKRNKLETLKEDIYSNGVSSLNEKQTKKYNNAVKSIDNIVLRGLTKVTKNKEAVKDKLRVKTVISQYLELLCIAADKDKYKEHWYSKGKEIEVRQKVRADAISFIKEACAEGSITEAEKDAYLEAVNTIYSYRNRSGAKNEVYQMRSDENGTYVNLEDAIEYYEDPVVYTDKDKNGDEKDFVVFHIVRK